MALREAKLDTSPIPGWDHEGFTTPGLPDKEVLKSWLRLKKYHMPLTVQLEQPPEWWDDMEQCEAIYNTLLEQAYEEKARMNPDA